MEQQRGLGHTERPEGSYSLQPHQYNCMLYWLYNLLHYTSCMHTPHSAVIRQQAAADVEMCDTVSVIFFIDKATMALQFVL